MTQPDEPAAESTALTLEILAGRQLRLLRQGRGWSQAEVAERMKAYGYSWNQSTVTRIESASRPTRLNELADLAALYEVPFIRLLRPDPAPDEGESLEAIEREIRSLLRARVNAIHAADAARRWLAAAQEQSYVATDGVQRIDSRLQTLKLWHPRYGAIAQETLEGIAEASATADARRLASALGPEDDAALGVTPEQAREMRVESLLRPYSEVLDGDQVENIRSVFARAVDGAMADESR